MATGDLKNNIKQLQSELKTIKFTQNLDIDGIIGGSPLAYLGIYHYLFIAYNPQLNSDISSSNIELYGKNDRRFVEAVYKILRDMFDYKPQINREQFFTCGFAERKVIMATDVLKLVRMKYKPPKSSTFRVAAAVRAEAEISPREKVQQEPVACSIASKSLPTIAGAIALHGGYKIPKSAVLGQQLPIEDQFCENPPVTTKTHKSKAVSSSNSGIDVPTEGCTKEVQEPILKNHHPLVHESIDIIMSRIFSDMVTPSLLMVNDRIRKLERDVMNPLKITTDLSSLPALVAGLTEQMTDVTFKLDTLASKVVLIENRLLLIEAKLAGESFKQVPNESTSYPSTQKYVADDSESMWSNRNNNMNTSNEEILAKESDEAEKNEDEESNNIENNNNEKNVVDDINTNVAVIKENAKVSKVLNSNLEFIRALVDNNDLENTLNSDVVFDANVNNDSQKLTSKPTKSNKFNEPHFDDVVSPIRTFTASNHIQDESMMSNMYEAEINTNNDDRRSSTPSHLDTSTMERVSRINQMMTELLRH